MRQWTSSVTSSRIPVEVPPIGLAAILQAFALDTGGIVLPRYKYSCLILWYALHIH